jgi:hypothetical protein
MVIKGVDVNTTLRDVQDQLNKMIQEDKAK